MSLFTTGSPRPEPAWVLRGDGVEDVDLGILKTGKEADVYLVERHYEGGSCLLAHKRYRSSQHRDFERDAEYRDDRFIKDHRMRRAVAKKTAFGRQVKGMLWSSFEFEVMRQVWQAGLDVPYPVDITDDGMLLEYLGTADAAAMRLNQGRLTQDELVAARDGVVGSLRALTRMGIVHGDLSPYNVLWWQGRAWLIDFPQACDLIRNEHGFDLLHRDVVNVCTWFGRKGLPLDADKLFADLLDDALGVVVEPR